MNAENSQNLLAQIATLIGSLEAADRQLDKEIGARFNVFSLFRADENAASRALAFLLDPKETHGQGDTFLRLFLKTFLPTWLGTFDTGRARRAFTSQLIDVTLTDGRYWLGIENKVFGAPEQKEQVDRYLDALKSKANKCDYLLLYLSPEGTPPTSYSHTDNGRVQHPEKLLVRAWAPCDVERKDGEKAPSSDSVLDWLVNCEKECPAENVRSFLKQFGAYVRAKVTGERPTNMVDAGIIKLATSNPQNLAGALLICKSGLEIRKAVLRPFLREIEKRLQDVASQKGEDWEVCDIWPKGRWSEDPAQKELPILLRRRSWPVMVGVAIQGERAAQRELGLTEVLIGIGGVTEEEWNKVIGRRWWYGEPRQQFIGPKSRKRLEDLVTNPTNGWWVWWQPLRDTEGYDIFDWTDPETLVRLNEQRSLLCDTLNALITKQFGRLFST